MWTFMCYCLFLALIFACSSNNEFVSLCETREDIALSRVHVPTPILIVHVTNPVDKENCT